MNEVAFRSILKFVEFVKHAHARVGHLRKYTSEPYEIHLAEVAAYAAAIYEDYQAEVPLHVFQAVAWGHDLFEDTDATESEIFEALQGWPENEIKLVISGIRDLTDPPRKEMNRYQRVVLRNYMLNTAKHWVQGLKCCDTLSNFKSLAVHDPAFTVTYLKEKSGQVFLVDTQNHPKITKFLNSYMLGLKHVIEEQCSCTRCGKGIMVQRTKDVVYNKNGIQMYFRDVPGMHCTKCTHVVLDPRNLGVQEKNIKKAVASGQNPNIELLECYDVVNINIELS